MNVLGGAIAIYQIIHESQTKKKNNVKIYIFLTKIDL